MAAGDIERPQTWHLCAAANLPNTDLLRLHRVYLVYDGLTFGDVTTGGGAFIYPVWWDGSAWEVLRSGVSGSGTLNTIPLWTPDGTTLGNSIITQVSGDRIHVAGDMLRLSSVFPELRLHDTNSGNEFSIRSITQLRFGTETGTNTNAAFYVLAGIGANVIFNGMVGMGTASIAANIRLKLKSLASGSDVLRIESFNGVEIAAIHDDSDNAMLDLQDSGGTQRIRLHAGTDEGNYIDNPLTVGSTAAPEAALFVVEETAAAASDRLIRCQSSEGNHVFDVRAFSDGRGLIEMRNTAGQQVQIYTDGDSYFKGGDFAIGKATANAKLDVDGAILGRRKMTTLTSNTTIDTTYGNIELDASGGAFTATLPASPSDGETYHWSKVDGSNIATLDANGKTINGSSTVAISAQYTAFATTFSDTLDEWRVE